MHHIISDLHLEFHQDVRSMDDLIKKYPFLKRDDSTKDCILLLAGDIGSFFEPNLKLFLKDCGNIYQHVIYVLGNHEYYSVADHTIKMIENLASETIKSINDENKSNNVHFLNKTSIVINGIKYMGCTLWTNIIDWQREKITNGINDYKLIIKEEGIVMTTYDTTMLHKEHVEWLTKELGETEIPTIIITHHLPTSKMSHPKYAIYNTMTSAFYTNLEHLITGNLKLWVCGHTHSYMKSKIGETTFITSPFGYAHECFDAKIETFSL